VKGRYPARLRPNLKPTGAADALDRAFVLALTRDEEPGKENWAPSGGSRRGRTIEVQSMVKGKYSAGSFSFRNSNQSGALMAARYHPLYDGLWSHEAFDATDSLPAASFEERGFFAYLCSNTRQHPSGNLSRHGRTASRRLDLARRQGPALPGGAPGARPDRPRRGRAAGRGIPREATAPRKLLKAAHDRVISCESEAIATAFFQRYPLLRQWSTDRRATVDRRSGNGRATVERKPSSEQSRSEQSRSEQSSEPSTDRSQIAHAISEDERHEENKRRALKLVDQVTRLRGAR
jgi:hypothetical protein